MDLPVTENHFVTTVTFTTQTRVGPRTNLENVVYNGTETDLMQKITTLISSHMASIKLAHQQAQKNNNANQ